jgi:geranylgeranyl diphosphate synthase type II
MTTPTGAGGFAAALDSEREAVETRLRELVDAHVSGPENISGAIRYCVLDTGKRLRPILCVWTHDALGGSDRDTALDVACAIECLHTYTLIHDDLPCMDDDDMRRGKPSCHVMFGEAVAVLTGDALLTLCFEILSSIRERRDTSSGIIVDVAGVIARAAGTAGLIAGQALDLEGNRLEQNPEMVDHIHRHKTAALIAASMECGAIVAGADAGMRDRVRSAGMSAGQAFQIVDDVLDLETDGETLGKTPGKDVKAGKLTYPSVAGVAASRERAAQLVDAARGQLGEAVKSSRLGELLGFLVTRKA